MNLKELRRLRNNLHETHPEFRDLPQLFFSPTQPGHVGVVLQEHLIYGKLYSYVPRFVTQSRLQQCVGLAMDMEGFAVLQNTYGAQLLREALDSNDIQKLRSLRRSTPSLVKHTFDLTKDEYERVFDPRAWDSGGAWLDYVSETDFEQKRKIASTATATFIERNFPVEVEAAL